MEADFFEMLARQAGDYGGGYSGDDLRENQGRILQR